MPGHLLKAHPIAPHRFGVFASHECGSSSAEPCGDKIHISLLLYFACRSPWPLELSCFPFLVHDADAAVSPLGGQIGFLVDSFGMPTRQQLRVIREHIAPANLELVRKASLDEAQHPKPCMIPSPTEFSPGDYVVATVRRPGKSIYDLIGTNDMTTDDVYYERGINLRHGYLTEYYVDDAEYIVKIPQGLKRVGVLLEPFTVVEKGIPQAYEIQRRLKVWRPRKAAVMGAGTIGLLATLALRLRGIDVTTFARNPKPNLNAELIEAVGARYMISQELPIKEGAQKFGAI